MPALQIPNHAHCTICGTPVAYFDPKKASNDDRTCSKECLADLEELNKKRKRSMWTMYGLMAIAMIVLLLSSSGLM